LIIPNFEVNQTFESKGIITTHNFLGYKLLNIVSWSLCWLIIHQTWFELAHMKLLNI